MAHPINILETLVGGEHETSKVFVSLSEVRRYRADWKMMHRILSGKCGIPSGDFYSFRTTRTKGANRKINIQRTRLKISTMNVSSLYTLGQRTIFRSFSPSKCYLPPFLLSTLLSRSFATPSGDKSSKPNLNVGTIGHIDHGKTTLTAAITHVLAKKGKAKPIKFDEIDKAKEEKKRGITINVAHLGYESDKRRYSHTDCPGHADFIKNMICGTSQMDAAVLVIAATDGVMAQTKEHLVLARQVGVRHVIIFINKADLVEEDVLDLVEIEARELLELHGFDADNATVIRGSALSALEGQDDSSVLKLMEALDEVPEPDRQEDTALVMPVASRTAITGRGTVIVGTIEKGTLKKGDKLEIKGEGKVLTATASDIHVFGKSVKEVRAGDHCGVLCRGVKTDSVKRGMWLGHLNSVNMTNHIKAEFYLLSEEENGRRTGIRTGFTDKVYCSTWDQVARFDMDQELLMPGEHISTNIYLMKEMPLREGFPFTLREGKTKQTIARGIVSQVFPSVKVENYNLKKVGKEDST